MLVLYIDKKEFGTEILYWRAKRMKDKYYLSYLVLN